MWFCGPGEMAQQVRAVNLLADEAGSVPSAHSGSQPRVTAAAGSDICRLQALHVYGAHTQAYTHTYKINDF